MSGVNAPRNPLHQAIWGVLQICEDFTRLPKQISLIIPQQLAEQFMRPASFSPLDFYRFTERLSLNSCLNA